MSTRRDIWIGGGGLPSGNGKMKSVSRFCKQFSAITKRRRWGTFSQLFPCTTIRYSKHHNNKTAVCPQFPCFLWQVLLVDPYRRANSAMWHFFPCQVHLFKSYHASFWTSALVKEKIDKFFFTHQQIKFAKSCERKLARVYTALLFATMPS